MTTELYQMNTLLSNQHEYRGQKAEFGVNVPGNVSIFICHIIQILMKDD